VSGHELDFEDIVRRYRRELHVYCYRMLGSLEEAEDHVQEVLARAWRSRGTVPAVNSALQRAHATLRQRWPGGRLDWAPSAEPDTEQSKLLQRYIDAHELADPQALIEVLHDDVRLSISPAVGQWTGREQVGDNLRANMNILGRWRLLPITANRQPGAAVYLRRPGDDTFRPFAICVLRIEQGKLIDIAAFEQPSLFPAFGLPPSL
jgi:RNA polymerase sigma-70 factor (ECF subfamily)